jgi:hypothetical protein
LAGMPWVPAPTLKKEEEEKGRGRRVQRKE